MCLTVARLLISKLTVHQKYLAPYIRFQHNHRIVVISSYLRDSQNVNPRCHIYINVTSGPFVTEWCARGALITPCMDGCVLAWLAHTQNWWIQERNISSHVLPKSEGMACFHEKNTSLPFSMVTLFPQKM